MALVSPKQWMPPSVAGLFLIKPQATEGGTFSAVHHFSSDTKSYAVFISHEGVLYPPALSQYQIPLSRFLIIQTPNSQQTWKTALEAAQSNLFQWIFLRTSQPCESSFLRKLQLASEKYQIKIFLFSNALLPHWFFKKLVCP